MKKMKGRPTLYLLKKMKKLNPQEVISTSLKVKQQMAIQSQTACSGGQKKGSSRKQTTERLGG
jgi:hypothetical protein